MQPLTVVIGAGMLLGVEAQPVWIEATMRSAGDGTPRILGLVDAAVREAYHRVLQAFHGLGLPSPRGVTTVNFAPASVRKSGSGFDLPLALALAGAAGLFPPERARGLCAAGEVSLRGHLLPARGAVSIAMMARASGFATLLCSRADAAACAGIDGLEALGADSLADAIHHLAGRIRLPRAEPLPTPPEPLPSLDLADIRGHETPKRALCTAAAGGHNLLLCGPPGSGKTALCRRLPDLLPAPSDEERRAIRMVQATAGLPDAAAGRRPLRAPHHSSSCASLLGGGADLRPGEATLAHHGVLFLDEFAEFRRDALEGLRQPLEDGVVTIGRARGTVTMPAAFMLVAAMNPCPCGFLGHPQRPCLCTPPMLARYRQRLSGPLLDRIDLQVEVPFLPPASLRGPRQPEWSTAALRPRIVAAHERQRARNRRGDGSVLRNAQLADALLERCCRLPSDADDALCAALQKGAGGGRARVRLLRIARTLADLDDCERVRLLDVLEALALRGFDQPASQGAFLGSGA